MKILALLGIVFALLAVMAFFIAKKIEDEINNRMKFE